MSAWIKRVMLHFDLNAFKVFEDYVRDQTLPDAALSILPYAIPVVWDRSRLQRNKV